MEFLEKQLKAQEKDDDKSLSGSESETETEEEVDTGLTENQNRLLYMIDRYSHKAVTADDKNEWIRKSALLVLIYEGIVANVLDYDYAPQSDCIENRRVYLNMTQEGKSDVEFLREEELIAGLQLSSKSFKPVSCYQITEKGLELIKRISRKEKEAVHEFIYVRGSRDLLQVRWDGIHYWLVSDPTNFSRKSSITDCEDVSYVSSAYIPQCLRYGGRPTLSNAHRAHESGGGEDNLRDELDEVITLNSISIIVAEFIPFGANQIVQLNQNMGSTERCQGGFISPYVDSDSAGTGMEITPDLTSVDILDYTLTNHINFEADINFVEDSGVVQVETFGVSLNAEGTCFYGMQIESVNDRIKDNISLDNLSRLLVDVQQDSSAIVNSVIAGYQRDLLQLIFLGDAGNRNKINLIIANEITPHLTAEEYMDKGEYENELRQVIGDTKAAYDISEHDTLVFGSGGLLVAGPNCRHHEPLLCAYLQFVTIDIFVQNYFARLWILNDDMAVTNTIIENAQQDPNALNRIRYRICKLSRDAINLEEILLYLLEALEIIEIPPEPPEQSGRSLYERLEIGGMRSQLVRRSKDLTKNVNGSTRYLNTLREMSSVVSEQRLFRLNESLDQTSKKLCTLQESSERAANSLAILQTVFAGTLAFGVCDRVTGEWTVMNTSWLEEFATTVVRNNAFVWFGLNIGLWGFFAILLTKWLKMLTRKAAGTTYLRLELNRKVDMEKLIDLLKTKHFEQEERDYQSEKTPQEKCIVKQTYRETNKAQWGTSMPLITIEYDEKNSFLLTLIVVYNRIAAKQMAWNAPEIREILIREYEDNDIFDDKAMDLSSEDLATDKRESIEKRIQAGEADPDSDEEGEGEGEDKNASEIS